MAATVLKGDDISGVAISLGYLQTALMTGLATGAYTQTHKSTGLTIGIFNRTDVLNGVQIGLLNYVGNNPSGLKWLPGINAHF